MKRLVDLSLALILGFFLAPLIFLVAIVTGMTSGRPILFRQERVGKYGQIFQIYKFRSMKLENGKIQESIENNLNDPRITPWGYFMRKFSLDELPQLFNVIRGEMGMVGHRPYLPNEIDQKILKIERILSRVPGITGLWQVRGRNQLGLEERLSLDVYYVENYTFSLDLEILIRTVWVVISGTGM